MPAFQLDNKALSITQQPRRLARCNQLDL